MMLPRPLMLADGKAVARRDGLPLIAGVLNVTPDSFSDGGNFIDPQRAIDHAVRMAAAGADIIDIGAESSRPGASPVDAAEEWRRLKDILPRLCVTLSVPVSIDTYRHDTALRALDTGAAMINDIGAARMAGGDMLGLAAKRKVPICLMHMRQTPRTMQDAPDYVDVCAEVSAFLTQRSMLARNSGVAADKIVVDPGFGFGKRPEHNVQLVKHLVGLRSLGLVLIGLSRKSTLGVLTGTKDNARLPESLAGAVACMLNGADIIRVHDVEDTVRALTVARAMLNE